MFDAKASQERKANNRTNAEWQKECTRKVFQHSFPKTKAKVMTIPV